MEEPMRCKKLRATFGLKNGMLGGPHKTEFTIERPSHMRIVVEQLGIREITISSETYILAENLYTVFSRLERLLMLFDGSFYELNELEFLEPDVNTRRPLSTLKIHYINHRLRCFNSSGFCKYHINKLLDFDVVLNEELYYKWEEILEKLDIVHQVFLYSLCDSGLPVDIKCAFLIELAEPLVEISKEYRDYFKQIEPGERGTTLKDCLKALIEKFGLIIFEKELSGNREVFYQTLKNSRVRVMHVKRKKDRHYFDGQKSVLYSIKMSTLYRVVILSLLNVNTEIYQDNLFKCVKVWNEWNDNCRNF